MKEMIKKKIKKSLRIIIFLGVFLGVALIISFFRINEMTGKAILEYTNETSCVNAGYKWKALSEKKCTNITICTNKTIEHCECIEYESVNDTLGDCINWTSCINKSCSEEQNCTDIIVGGQCMRDICDSKHLNLCFEEEDCVSAGGYWHYNNSCHLEEETLNEDLSSETDEEIPEEIVNESQGVEQNIINKTEKIIEKTGYNLTNKEREVLINKFGNESVKITKAELVEGGIEITFRLSNYFMIRFYDADFSKEELSFQIEKDRINWLKDIANILLQKDNSPEKISDFIEEYPI